MEREGLFKTSKVVLVSKRALTSGLLRLLLGLFAAHAACADDWLPVSSDELQLKSEPAAPVAPAIFLYRQVDRSDVENYEHRYYRIKILNEEGLKYANVEIPFTKNTDHIGSISARTIRPDGSIAKFDGTVYEKPIIKAKHANRFIKSFTLPDVQVGSIIEYQYSNRLPPGFIYDSHWILSEDLFTRHAKFSLQPYRDFEMSWSWPRGLPTGTTAPKLEHGKVVLESNNIPAFVTEEYMPPENEMRYRVDFIYEGKSLSHKDPATYWKQASKVMYDEVHHFIDQSSTMRAAVAQTVSASDTPEQKLRKLYARASQIINTDFETDAEREAKDQKPESIHDVADVWKKGYGTADQITWLYLALVQAAGIEAYPVMVSTRDKYFFESALMNSSQLNSNVVLVKLDGRDLFLDPGLPFTHFGLLPWSESAVKGLRLEKDSGTWVETSQAVAADSRIMRKADLKYERGALRGKVTVTYTGLEASYRRLEQRSEDNVARQKYLETELHDVIPSGSSVTLTNTPAWNSWEDPLIAEYDLDVPGWATPAGHRALLAVGLFGGDEKETFEHAVRTQPLYFDYRYQHDDDITISLPSPWSIESTPKETLIDLQAVVYKSIARSESKSLHLTRELAMNMTLVDKKYYESIRRFYEQVRTCDEEQAVLSNAPDVAKQ